MTTSAGSPGLTLLAGLVSVLSPCVLPVVPGYLATVSALALADAGGGKGRRIWWRAALYAVLFMAGFALIFLLLGASGTMAGGVVREALPLLQRLGGAALALFGLLLLGAGRIVRVPRWTGPGGGAARALGAGLAGVAFGAGWTPCVGPTLATALMYASFDATLARGVALLAIYALGLSLPFLLVGVSVATLLLAPRAARRWIPALRPALGALLLLAGVLLLSGRLAAMTTFLARFSPPIEIGA